MQTLTEQKNNLEANNPEEIKKLFPFVITRDYEQFSGWHNLDVNYTEYGFKKGNNKYWFGRMTSNKSKSWDYDDIIIILNTLKKSGFKFACNYCGKGMLGSPNKFLNPIDFIKWVTENNYQFEDFTSIETIKKGYWRFSGNLKEYSCAFWFDIFDKKLVTEIITKTGLIIKEG